MKLITLKPNTPSKRHYFKIFTQINRIYKKNKLKNKLLKHKNLSGRNCKGKITIRHRGGGHKKIIRKIDFNIKNNSNYITYSIEYDPNRNSFIASIFNITLKKFFYIIAPKNLEIGNIIKTGNNSNNKLGHKTKIKNIPKGCPIFNISIKTKKNSKLSRSAGTYSLLLNKKIDKSLLLLSSGKTKLIANNSECFIGIVSNQFFFLKQKGKAGRTRWLNFRPSVRGVAMNPIDHPNGGGEGKKSSQNKNPWGKKHK